MVFTLPQNQAKVEAIAAELAHIKARSLTQRAAAREKEIADSGDGDFTRLQAADGRSIDLAIHKDTFLDDAGISTDVDAETALYWKTRYAPVVGMTTGSTMGGGMATMYVTQDGYNSLTPFVVDTEEVKIPSLLLSQDPDKLGQREAALGRVAERIKIAFETYAVNFMTGQPLGTDLATSITNYVAANSSYTGKTVYVADPGVQSGTYETTNIIDVHTEGGLSAGVAEAIINQAMLSKRNPRTIHIPVAGMPWRTLMRSATIVATSFTNNPNPTLRSVPTAQWEDLWNQNFASGLVLNWFGHTLKFKANNALPQGYAIVTTDQPAFEMFNVMSKRVSMDYAPDPRDTYFHSHYEKFEVAYCVPDPWLRNAWYLYFGNTNLT